MGLSHINLESYLEITFALAQHHHWSIRDIENLIPFERDIYVQMLSRFLDAKRIEMEQKK